MIPDRLSLRRWLTSGQLFRARIQFQVERGPVGSDDPASLPLRRRRAGRAMHSMRVRGQC
jgi:hypothetical protein